MFSGFLLKGDYKGITQAVVCFDDLLLFNYSESGKLSLQDIVIRQDEKSKKFFIYAYNIADSDPYLCVGEDEIRSFYRDCLKVALEHKIKSIRFPEVKSFRDEPFDKIGCSIAIDEINKISSDQDIDVYIELEDKHFSDEIFDYQKRIEDYIFSLHAYAGPSDEVTSSSDSESSHYESETSPKPGLPNCLGLVIEKKEDLDDYYLYENTRFFVESDEEELLNRIKKIKEPFSKHLLFLMEKKGLTPQKVYERAYMDRRLFSKIKNNEDYHPKKITVLCLCVALHLNVDESKKFLATAGYTFSPSSMTDIIFGYFIEKAFYDIAEIDCQLNRFGLPGIFRDEDSYTKILK